MKILIFLRVILNPDKDIDIFIYSEAIIVVIIDFIICFCIILLGIILMKHFNLGLKRLHKRKLMTLVKPKSNNLS